MVELDEMEQAIRQRSQVYAFRLVVLALALWTLYGLFSHFIQGASYNPLPTLLLCGTFLYQVGWESYLKHAMVKDGEDFQEPSMLVQGAFAVVAIAVILIAVGLIFTVDIA